MKTLVLLLGLLFANTVYSSSYRWECSMWSYNVHPDDCELQINGKVIISSEASLAASIYDVMFAYWEAGDVYVKQYDYTSMMVGHSGTWFIAYFGELISETTVDNFKRVPLCDWYDDRHIDGQKLDDPLDFYLGFRTNDEYVYDDIPRYGWLHLSIDDELNASLLDSGVGLYGESVLVGIGPAPEPSAGMLFVVGSLSLLLRRWKMIKQV